MYVHAWCGERERERESERERERERVRSRGFKLTGLTAELDRTSAFRTPARKHVRGNGVESASASYTYTGGKVFL